MAFTLYAYVVWCEIFVFVCLRVRAPSYKDKPPPPKRFVTYSRSGLGHSEPAPLAAALPFPLYALADPPAPVKSWLPAKAGAGAGGQGGRGAPAWARTSEAIAADLAALLDLLAVKGPVSLEWHPERPERGAGGHLFMCVCSLPFNLKRVLFKGRLGRERRRCPPRSRRSRRARGLAAPGSPGRGPGRGGSR